MKHYPNHRLSSSQRCQLVAALLSTCWCLCFVTDERVRAGDDRKSDARQTAAVKSDPTRKLASIGDGFITQADVDLSLGRTASGRSDLPPAPQAIVRTTVDIIARQRQALQSLKRAGKRVPDESVNKWLLENSPGELKLSAADALAARAQAASVTPENYREFLAFRLSWQAYLQSMLTEKNLEKHFAREKARFDGTRFQVEHLWIPAPPGKSPVRDAAHARMDQIRKQVIDGQLEWSAASRQLNSEQAAQSSEAQWITGSGPMMPAIVDQVLKTPAGELSKPFDSAQAVHLIRVLAIEPGERVWSEAQEDVRQHILLYLLDYLAKQSADRMPLVWLGDA